MEIWVHPADMNLCSPVGKRARHKAEDVEKHLDAMFFPPLSGKWKGLIVENVDRLPHTSHDALLKVLEEPPEYMMIVLITSQPQRLRATLCSRVWAVHFPSRFALPNSLRGKVDEFLAQLTSITLLEIETWKDLYDQALDSPKEREEEMFSPSLRSFTLNEENKETQEAKRVLFGIALLEGTLHYVLQRMFQGGGVEGGSHALSENDFWSVTSCIEQAIQRWEYGFSMSDVWRVFWLNLQQVALRSPRGSRQEIPA